MPLLACPCRPPCRSQLVQCEEGFKQTLAEVARWRQEVDAKVAPLEASDAGLGWAHESPGGKAVEGLGPMLPTGMWANA